eukprot:c13877_g1_i1.p1 GENE.c13877_g1_i1~~c13877_g1_i1.p1  ORF type:complete len:337 (-),score=86.26 c13877_g1_i1:34-1044(-)
MGDHVSNFLFASNHKMSRQLVIFFLMFLIGTSHMQSVAASASVSLINNKIAPSENISIATFKKIVGELRETCDNMKARFDKNGNLDKIIRAIVPGLGKVLGEQNLVQLERTEQQTLLLTAESTLLAASIFLLFGTTVSKIEFEKIPFFLAHNDGKAKPDHSQSKFIRMQVANFLFLISSALWFEGFLLLANYTVNDNQDFTAVAPIAMKILASVFFSIQPMTTFMKFVTNHKEAGGDMKWPNFIGISLFHISNMMTFAFAFKRTKLTDDIGPNYYEKHAQQYATIFFTVATCFLFAGDERVAEQTRISPVQKSVFQFLGDSLLVVGSALYLFKPFN